MYWIYHARRVLGHVEVVGLLGVKRPDEDKSGENRRWGVVLDIAKTVIQVNIRNINQSELQELCEISQRKKSYKPVFTLREEFVQQLIHGVHPEVCKQSRVVGPLVAPMGAPGAGYPILQ